ncbi:MAG: hypothetical protein WD336_03640, partial [Trueperaceae bacterium]
MSDPAAPRTPLRGRSGPLDAAGLLKTLLDLGATGTLAVGSHAALDATDREPAPLGACLTLIEAGESIARQKLGHPPSDDATDLPFLFHSHDLPAGPMHGVPELPALLPAARAPGLLSVPRLPGSDVTPAGLIGLTQATEWAARSRFDGVLSVGGGATARRDPDGDADQGADGTDRSDDDGDAYPLVAAAWWVEGRLVAALGERDGREVRRSDALRLFARLAADPNGPPLAWAPLPRSVLCASLGVAQDRRKDAPSGLRIGQNDATYLQGGVPILRTAHPRADRKGRFAAVDDDALTRMPALPLPVDPPDWESRTYQLTLRGRDALDPMTELAMRFDREVGPSGKRILVTLRRGLTVRDAADDLGLDLDQLGAWLRRLE